jgi:uncharacterized protein YfaA (DUF2138 family)
VRNEAATGGRDGWHRIPARGAVQGADSHMCVSGIMASGTAKCVCVPYGTQLADVSLCRLPRRQQEDDMAEFDWLLTPTAQLSVRTACRD